MKGFYSILIFFAVMLAFTAFVNADNFTVNATHSSASNVTTVNSNYTSNATSSGGSSSATTTSSNATTTTTSEAANATSTTWDGQCSECGGLNSTRCFAEPQGFGGMRYDCQTDSEQISGTSCPVIDENTCSECNGINSIRCFDKTQGLSDCAYYVCQASDSTIVSAESVNVTDQIVYVSPEALNMTSTNPVEISADKVNVSASGDVSISPSELQKLRDEIQQLRDEQMRQGDILQQILNFLKNLFSFKF